MNASFGYNVIGINDGIVYGWAANKACAEGDLAKLVSNFYNIEVKVVEATEDQKVG